MCYFMKAANDKNRITTTITTSVSTVLMLWKYGTCQALENNSNKLD